MIGNYPRVYRRPKSVGEIVKHEGNQSMVVFELLFLPIDADEIVDEHHGENDRAEHV